MAKEPQIERMRARAVAILVSLAMPFAAFLPLDYMLGGESSVLWPATWAAYAAVAAILGFIWPEPGWRLGAWLFAAWPLLLVLAALFSDGPLVGPAGWKGLLQDLAAYSLMLVAACLGAEIGAIIKRRQGRLPVAANSSRGHE
ncbi:MAG TPA: hypothetical protein VIP46_06125 [Pyrinomonadaceae bacterium]